MAIDQTSPDASVGHRALPGEAESPGVGAEDVAAAARRWRRPPDLALLGTAAGSGLREASYLVRRGDGQMVQLSELTHLVLLHLDERLHTAEVAERVSGVLGRTLTPEGLARLIASRLAPLGLAEPADEEHTTTRRLPRARPLLSLTLKGTLLGPALSNRLGHLLKPLFWPPVVVIAVGGFVAASVWVWAGTDFWAAIATLFATPTLLLALYGLVVAGAVIHELGHATACRYSGASPGAIGVGVYIVFPAFYTDVTDSYRLGRAGRVRTALGGLYFNVLTVLGLLGLYAGTGSAIFLLAGLALQIQMAQQLIPLVRFDGYYVLADLAGVPDLFTRIGPVLKSLRPHAPPQPRVTELKPLSRWLITGWVLVVVPTLVAVVAWFLWNLPRFVAEAVAGLRMQRSMLVSGWEAHDVPMVALAVLSGVLLVLPMAGVAVLAWRALAAIARAVGKRLARALPDDTVPAATVTEGHVASAADFTDAVMLPARRPIPTAGWRRTLLRITRGRLNPGPSPAERSRAELEARLRTPIHGSRRVVVMSRKGGVGKTTMTLALGTIFAGLRGDRVIAVDANPDAGNLAHRIARTHQRTITDVLGDSEVIDRYARLREYTAQAEESRLEVLASDDDPRIGQALDRCDYHRLISLLDRFYNLILLDTGTGILDSANQGLLSEADQVVLVLTSGLDGGRAAALTLDWMDQHGFADLVARAVVVINCVRDGVGAPREPMRHHFEQRCAQVLEVPWDPALETGAQTELSGLGRATRDSLVHVAAAVAERFRERMVSR